MDPCAIAYDPSGNPELLHPPPHLSEVRHIHEDDFSLWTKRATPTPGDIVFTYEATLNRYAMIPDGFRGCLGRRTALIRTNPELVDRRYVFYQFFGSEWRETIGNNILSGSTVDRIPIARFPGFEIRLPPLAVQRKIASILAAYDDLIENNLRRIKILEEMAQSLYKEWFVDFRFPGHENVRMADSPLGMIPEGWEALTISGSAELVTRGISPRYDDEGQVVVLNQRCIRNRQVNLAESRLHGDSFPPQKQVSFGDVLVNSTGVGTLGRTAQVYKDLGTCVVDSHVTIVRPSSTVEKDYFGMAVMALESHFELQGAGATGQTELGRDSIRNTPIVLPPRPIQESFSALVKPLRQLCLVLTERNDRLRQSRDLLLPKLISGELDISGLDIDVGETAA